VKPWDFADLNLEWKLDLINYNDIRTSDEIELKINLAKLGALDNG
jgi:hypothetical protein